MEYIPDFVENLEEDNMGKIRAGIDIGGTFTDIVLLDYEGNRYFGKTLTTYPDPSEGFLKGIDETLKKYGFGYEDIDVIIHGTTLVTNALIERKGAKTALITTEGFKDTIEIGTEQRFDLYDLMIDKSEPLVPRHLRYGVRERILADGSIYEPLDEEEVKQLLLELKEKNVEAIAVSFLHSYRNPVHEKRVKEIAKEVVPDIPVAISSEVASEIREFQRTSTVVANVFVQPLVERYLTDLRDKLNGRGFVGQFHMMLSSGGTCTIETACKYPIRILESGPVGGTIAGTFFSQRCGIDNMMAFDMGGTTAKTSLVNKGVPLITNDFEVGRQDRFRKGSGMPIKSPVIEMIEIGAGGGSIARINEMGMMKVGPESASSVPGPACYGRGGENPTITDADLVLGYLNPDYFLGGEMKLDINKAKKAIEEKIAKPLGISLKEAAWGIHRMVNENMAEASRIHATEKGIDIRKFVMFATGGAGPVHACNVATLLDMPMVISPVGAGVCSAFGFLSTPLSFDFVRTYAGELTELDWNMVNSLYAEMEADGMKIMKDSGVKEEDIIMERSCEMHFLGQSHDIRVTIPAGTLSVENIEEIKKNFYDKYTEIYADTGVECEVVATSWRLVVNGPKPVVNIQSAGEKYIYIPEPKNTRPVYWGEYKDYVETPVFDRTKLRPGAKMSGPAIIEERESTFIVNPSYDIKVDDDCNVVLVKK